MFDNQRNFVALTIGVVCLLSALYTATSSTVLTRLPSLTHARPPDLQRATTLMTDGSTNRDALSISPQEPANALSSVIPEQLSSYNTSEATASPPCHRASLVMAKTHKDNTDWVYDLLQDRIADGSMLPAIYVVDDSEAPLRPPKNKGNEAMVYLTYIIDNYDRLPEISVFMHSHRWAWHNNEVTGLDSSEMLRRLSYEKVIEDGYVNMRCHWMPGCPEWIHPGVTAEDPQKHEEVLIAEAWSELFPTHTVPPILAQPCCSQFAVSRAAILNISQARFMDLREWLLQTPLSNDLSGRIFEYLWHFIFTGSTIRCPSTLECYCANYKICFADDNALQEWMDYHAEQLRSQGDLELLKEPGKELPVIEGEASQDAIGDGHLDVKAGMEEERRRLEARIDWLRQKLDVLKTEAIQRGSETT